MKRNVAFMMAVATVVAAQAPPEIGPGIGPRMKQNAEALKQYTYKRRTEITVKGQSRGARVDLVRYVDGKMEAVPLETPPRRAESAGGRGLRGRMIQKKIEKKKQEMKEDVERLKSLLQAYVSSDSDSMRMMLEKATISRTGPGPDADVKMVATGLVKPSDSFNLIWSVANQRPVKIEIHADLDGKPVQVAVDYAALPDGAFYPVHTVIFAPKKDLSVSIDTFDYRPSSGAK